MCHRGPAPIMDGPCSGAHFAARPLPSATCDERSEALEVYGCVVKNTFIHVAYLQDSSAPPPRSASSVPSLRDRDPGVCARPRVTVRGAESGRWAGQASGFVEEEQTNKFCRGNSLRAELGSQLLSSTNASASSAMCLQHERLAGHDQIPNEKKHTSAAVIAKLIAQECGFLRTRGFEVCQCRESTFDLTHLRLFLHGLPLEGKSRWHPHLCLAVAAVLRRTSYTAWLQYGLLLVALGDQNSETSMFSIEFCAVTE